MSVDHYTGGAGAAYHRQREASRSSKGQASRAAYFADLTTSNDVVLDFGCATGAVLASLPAARRIGVEVNELASVEADSIDATISFHALEHVANPYEVLGEFRRVLRRGGRIRIIVPYDNVLLNPAHRRWSPDDRDMHLFGWTPLTLGNLLTASGFEVRGARVSHWASSGRLGRLIGKSAQWVKAIRGGRLQVIADAQAPG
jgi:hypothetical protein